MNCIDKILLDYQPDLLTDDERIYNIKTNINKLNDTDKAILALYLDEGSMEKVAKRLGVSAFTVWARLQGIRSQIKTKLK